MAETAGVNHIGLTVRDLDETTDFFTQILGWQEIARDETYPRTTITDGQLRLTLWQATTVTRTVDFDRRSNIGLHHLALTVASEADLNRLAALIASRHGVAVEFMPELVGKGPRKHMMFAEPGGIRLELIWPGQ